MCANLAKRLIWRSPCVPTPSSSLITPLWQSPVPAERLTGGRQTLPCYLLNTVIFPSFHPRSARSEQTPSYLLQTDRGNAVCTVHSSSPPARGWKNPLHCLNLGSVNWFGDHMLHLLVSWHHLNGDGPKKPKLGRTILSYSLFKICLFS